MCGVCACGWVGGWVGDNLPNDCKDPVENWQM